MKNILAKQRKFNKSNVGEEDSAFSSVNNRFYVKNEKKNNFKKIFNKSNHKNSSTKQEINNNLDEYSLSTEIYNLNNRMDNNFNSNFNSKLALTYNESIDSGILNAGDFEEVLQDNNSNDDNLHDDNKLHNDNNLHNNLHNDNNLHDNNNLHNNLHNDSHNELNMQNSINISGDILNIQKNNRGMLDICGAIKNNVDNISSQIESQISKKLQVLFSYSEKKMQEIEKQNIQLKQIILEKDRYIEKQKKISKNLELKIQAGLIELDTLNQKYNILLSDSHKKNKLIATMRSFE